MNTETIVRLLRNSGYHVLGADGSFIYMEDPGCILRSFDVFLDYAWLGVSFIAGMLLFAWAISLIRGIKTDMMMNIRNLVLIFGTLALARPIVNFIYGDDLFARGCRTISVSISEVNRLVDTRQLDDGDAHMENINIQDTGATWDQARIY
ncbi:hypothetical protein HDR63_01340 [bacterium]|nr:hypothetical protein [bacterium]